MVDEQRVKTMRERLGESVALIDNDQYLPMFRSRQIHHEELFNYSVNLAKTKNNPSKYFASIWGRKNLEKTVKWLTRAVNLLKSKLAQQAREKKQQKIDRLVVKEARKNHKNIEKLRKMKLSHGLRS